jgi:acyl-CoA thioesterase FadM
MVFRKTSNPMSRVKINLPSVFPFKTAIPVRITDINYGGHLGNDTVLTLIHEARMRFLKEAGLSELEFAGTSLIMRDVAIEFKAEVFYGDEITVYVAAGEFSRAGFNLYYKLVKGEETVVALAKTGLVCFDYSVRKVTEVPEEAKKKLRPTSYEL